MKKIIIIFIISVLLISPLKLSAEEILPFDRLECDTNITGQITSVIASNDTVIVMLSGYKVLAYDAITKEFSWGIILDTASSVNGFYDTVSNSFVFNVVRDDISYKFDRFGNFVGSEIDSKTYFDNNFCVSPDGSYSCRIVSTSILESLFCGKNDYVEIKDKYGAPTIIYAENTSQFHKWYIVAVYFILFISTVYLFLLYVPRHLKNGR